MIIDTHVHYTPEPLVRAHLKPGDKTAVLYEQGIPISTYFEELFRIDQHVAAMDAGGVDKTVLSTLSGVWPLLLLEDSLASYRMINDSTRAAIDRYPDRFFGMAHVPALGGDAAFAELERCVKELGFRGVAIPSEVGDVTLDSERLYPFYEKVCELGIYLFVHSSQVPFGAHALNDYDMARSLGREFSIGVALFRLINGGVLDAFPTLRVQVAHQGGGIYSLLPRLEKYLDKTSMGLVGDPKHGKMPQRPLAGYYPQIFFDTGGCVSTRGALAEIPTSQMVLGTDYPYDVRDGAQLAAAVRDIRQLPISADEIEGILGKNAERLLGIAQTAPSSGLVTTGP